MFDKLIHFLKTNMKKKFAKKLCFKKTVRYIFVMLCKKKRSFGFAGFKNSFQYPILIHEYLFA